jgi:hypothetical protein
MVTFTGKAQTALKVGHEGYVEVRRWEVDKVKGWIRMKT